jgi:integrase
MTRTPPSRAHSGHTESGNVRDTTVQRIGRVTIYKRGTSYYLYYRERGRTTRRKVDGNLAVARALASKTSASLEEGSPSPFGFTRLAIGDLLDAFIKNCEAVQRLAPRTVDRYRAALSHFKAFAEELLPLRKADEVTEADVEDFVQWLHGKRRTRNGAESGRTASYSASGTAFILGTCRTAFKWAKKRRFLPPYNENPFTAFGIGKLRTREVSTVQILTPEQQQAFFKACDDWQKPLFCVLALYGLRVGELTHLLVSDVDLREGRLEIRSKPEMFWRVKTQRERVLPIPAELHGLFERCIGGRREGFLFLNRKVASGLQEPAEAFGSRQALVQRLIRVAEQARADGAEDEREVAKTVGAFLRTLGQIPEKRIRQEFIKLTTKIGCPELTRAHSFRHLFSTRVQEQGANPLLVQGILGHTTLDMTWHYTHFGMDAKRQAISQMLQNDPVLRQLADQEDR